MGGCIITDLAEHLISLISLDDHVTVRAMDCTNMHLHALGLPRRFRRLNGIIDLTGKIPYEKHVAVSRPLHGTHTIMNAATAYCPHLRGIAVGKLMLDPRDTCDITVRYAYGKLIEISWPNRKHHYILMLRDRPVEFLNCIYNKINLVQIYLGYTCNSISYRTNVRLWANNMIGEPLMRDDIIDPRFIPYRDDLLAIIAKRAYTPEYSCSQ